ncbi:MAG: hypothetical protein ACKO6B_07985 [Planctomycetia bacterium]
MMQLPPATCVLLAAGFDWLEALLPFLFVAFWILSQVFAVFRRLQGGRPAGEPRRPPPLPRFDPAVEREERRMPAEEAADPRGDLAKQIEEFLREAKGENGKRPAATPTVARGPAGAPRPRPPRKRQAAAAQKPATQKADAPVAVATAARPHDAADESVARHVQDAFSRELTHLHVGLGAGREVGLGGALATDEQQARVVPPRQPTQAEELVHLLRSPATIRQVILLREVIDRPVDRW